MKKCSSKHRPEDNRKGMRDERYAKTEIPPPEMQYACAGLAHRRARHLRDQLVKYHKHNNLQPIIPRPCSCVAAGGPFTWNETRATNWTHRTSEQGAVDPPVAVCHLPDVESGG